MPGAYMNLKISSLLLWIGILMATLNLLVAVALTGATKIVLVALIQFVGVFITGWALLSFGFAKQLLPVQRTVALFFAAVVIVGLFGVAVTFHFNIT
jgi:hypothetical protein